MLKLKKNPSQKVYTFPYTHYFILFFHISVSIDSRNGVLGIGREDDKGCRSKSVYLQILVIL